MFAEAERWFASLADPGAVMTSAADFTTWLATSRARDRFVYHEGVLAADRHTWTDDKDVLHKAIPGVNELALAVAKAADQGLVALVQRRIGKGEWQYVAIRLSLPAARLRRYSIGRRIVELSAWLGLLDGA